MDLRVHTVLVWAVYDTAEGEGESVVQEITGLSFQKTQLEATVQSHIVCKQGTVQVYRVSSVKGASSYVGIRESYAQEYVRATLTEMNQTYTTSRCNPAIWH